MKTLVIINPASSGGRTLTRWPAMAEKLAAAIGPFDSKFTGQPGEACLMAREALEDGYSRIIAVGGDGTMNEVCNGFFEDRRAINPDAVMGLIHSGTGGDFRFNLGLPETLEGQIAAIASGNRKQISLGHASYTGIDGEPASHFFGVICAFGFSSELNKSVNSVPRLKKWLGPLVFFAMVIANLLKTQRHQVRFASGDIQFEGDILVGAAANGPRTGGAMMLAPEADPASTTLDFVMAESMSRPRILGLLPRLAKGSHIGRPGVRNWRGTSMKVEPSGDDPVYLDMDGDVYGTLPVTVSIVPTCMNVAVP